MDPAVTRRTAKLMLGLVLAATAVCAQGREKDCDELRSQIEAKLNSRGVQGFSLDIVEAGDTGSARVVGTCEGGSHRIVYARGGGKPTPDVPRPPPASNKEQKTKKKKAAPVSSLGNY